jgi:hypothetical protein
MTELSVPMRARVLETLSLIASEEKQREYQRAVPHVDVPAELFNQWEDCYFPKDVDFASGFADSELVALAKFDAELNRVCDDTPRVLPALDQFLATEAWRALSTAARDALAAIGG